MAKINDIVVGLAIGSRSVRAVSLHGLGQNTRCSALQDTKDRTVGHEIPASGFFGQKILVLAQKNLLCIGTERHPRLGLQGRQSVGNAKQGWFAKFPSKGS